jgi:hypothetical protein
VNAEWVADQETNHRLSRIAADDRKLGIGDKGNGTLNPCTAKVCNDAVVFSERRVGGAKEDRTPDLFAASEALSQLSYGPIWVRAVNANQHSGAGVFGVFTSGFKGGQPANAQRKARFAPPQPRPLNKDGMPPS